MPFQIITEDFKVNQVDQFLESLSETDKTYYYMFFGRHVPWVNGVVPELDFSKETLDIDAYSNMLFAKRIMPEDIILSIARVDWAEDTVYQAYDHRTIDPGKANFYVGVLEGSNYNVFKCLFNNGGVPSTVAPSFAAFSEVETADNETYDGYYETSDGYQWKYMYTIESAEFSKFATTRYVPLIANTEVSDFAINGSIDVTKVEQGGSGYNNFFSGEFSANSDIAYLGNSVFYAIRNTAGISPASGNDFYNGCIMKITAGRGAGQYREIIDYINSGNARYAIVNNAFSILPDTTSKFEITPKVTFTGSSSEAAVGRAMIGFGNSISSVEMLNRGRGYFTAGAIILQSNVASEGNTAVLTPIIPPKGGHGFSAKTELGAKWLTMSIKISGDENGFLPAGQKFGQVGILKDPLFSNLEISTSKYSNTAQPGRDGSFIEGETVIEFKPIRQAGTVSITVANNYIISTNTDVLQINSIVYPDSRVFVRGANAADWFTSKILTSNSSTLVLEDNSIFTTNAATLYISHSNTAAIHTGSGPTFSYLTNATPFFSRNSSVIGLTTYTTAIIDDIQINNRVINDFRVINQLDSISIDDPISTFSADDYLSDASNLNSCYFHSYANSNHIYVTNVRGNMSPGTVLRNPDASASIAVANKYEGQIVKESGSIIYLENHDLVSRANSESQTKKIIVEF